MLLHLLDALFPKRSIWERGGFWIPEEDWGDIPFNSYFEPKDSLQKRGITSLDGLLSAVRYNDSKLIQLAIGTFKYKRIPGLAVRLSQYIIKASLPHVHYDHTLVPIPLHWKRKMERGFNQSEFLTRYIADVTDMPYANLLRRTKDTGHQAWRSKYERMQSMTGAFVVRCHMAIPENIILIDDIATTGATLDACAEILKRSGAKRVNAWVIARV